MTTMYDLKQGQRARVSRLALSGSIRRRLRDIGLIEGTQVECLLRVSGGPAAYMIRGAVIALRQEDLANICVISI